MQPSAWVPMGSQIGKLSKWQLRAPISDIQASFSLLKAETRMALLHARDHAAQQLRRNDCNLSIDSFGRFLCKPKARSFAAPL